MCMISTAQSRMVITDGPYINYTDKGFKVNLIKKNNLRTKKRKEIIKESFDILPFDITVRGRQEYDLQFNFENVTKIAAISDIHGQYDVMIKLFTENGIIDENLNWTFGEGHLVITGDVFDRGDQVTEILWFIYKLEDEAQKAGGRIHMLLGNHEVMVLNGDVRYIHKKYRYSSAITKKMYSTLFDKNSVLGDWLRSKPVIISINDIVFLHAGFSKDLIDKNISIEDVNYSFKTKLIDGDKEEIEQDSILAEIYFNNGPIWYRGYIDGNNFTEEDADYILKKLDKKHIVVGHTSMQSIISLYDERIFMIDSSIKFGKTGEVLLWENSQFSRGTLTGQTISINPFNAFK